MPVAMDEMTLLELVSEPGIILRCQGGKATAVNRQAGRKMC